MSSDVVCYIALDPGETTGWAKFDENGEVIKIGQFRQQDQNRWLADNITDTVKGVIVEDYMNYGHKQQKKWSRNQTSKNIGAIGLLCSMRNVPCYLQPANIKSIGYKWSGLGAAPSNHNISHQYDAVAHGVYFLTTRGIRNPILNIPESER
jgi:hypothetical protein